MNTSKIKLVSTKPTLRQGETMPKTIESTKELIGSAALSNEVVVGRGPLEEAFRDAEAKIKFFERQELDAHKEKERWVEVSTKIREAMNLIVGPKAKLEKKPISKIKKGTNANWKEILPNYINSNGGEVTKEQIVKFMKETKPALVNPLTQLYSAQSVGYLKLDGDKVKAV